MEDFRSGGFQLAAKFVVLRLRGGEVRRVKESQFALTIRLGGLVPSRGAGRANQHALEGPHHGMSVECRACE